MLRSLVSGDSVAVYGVEYPASYDFCTPSMALTMPLPSFKMAESCSQTKMVLGGYSQGAAVWTSSPQRAGRSLDSQVRCRKPSLTTSRQWRSSVTRRTVSATRRRSARYMEAKRSICAMAPTRSAQLATTYLLRVSTWKPG